MLCAELERARLALWLGAGVSALADAAEIRAVIIGVHAGADEIGPALSAELRQIILRDGSALNADQPDAPVGAGDDGRPWTVGRVAEHLRLTSRSEGMLDQLAYLDGAELTVDVDDRDLNASVAGQLGQVHQRTAALVSLLCERHRARAGAVSLAVSCRAGRLTVTCDPADAELEAAVDADLQRLHVSVAPWLDGLTVTAAGLHVTGIRP